MTGPRRHLAFLPYPAYGHMMPVLPVVAELVARGHRVTCFATEDFEERVRATGAEVRPYDPPPLGPAAGEHRRRRVRPRPAQAARREYRGAADDRVVLFRGPPDAVVYDTTLWLTGRLLAARWQRPSIQLSPTFISNEHFDLSAQHQEYAGRVDPAHPAIVEFAARLTETVGSSGLRDEQKAELFYGRREFTLAFLPREFQFAGATFDERHAFVGPTCDGRQEDGWQPPASGAPVLLVSLGTTVNNRPDFFRHCAKAFADLPWHVVLALGDRVAPGELGELPPNVEAHRWVPMGAVLAHASVFLCQSGMGSIMESLYAGVPMVVVPHHPEQHVNARRLTELGLAEVVQRDEVSPEALRDAVARVAGDSGMRERVRDMREHVRAAGGARRAADVIEERLRTASLEVR